MAEGYGKPGPDPADAVIVLPPHAYVPGQTPRHDSAVFADLHSSVTPGMSTDALASCAAWQAGWVYLDQGYFWEAHEVFEPIWMQTPPNSVERQFVQAAIQVANASLKHRMGKPRAVLRLCDIAERHLAHCGEMHHLVMGVDLERVHGKLIDLRGRIG